MRVVGWAVLAAACNEPWIEREEAGLRVLEATRTSHGTVGRVRSTVDVLDGETALAITAAPPSPERVVFLWAKAPSGELVYDVDAEWAADRNKTGARFVADVLSLNWPIRDDDAPLVPGSWRLDAGAVGTNDNYRAGVDVPLTLVLKSDPDFAAGALRARVVYLGNVADDAEIVEATEAAVAWWQDIYAAVGIDVEVRYDRFDSDELPQQFGEGSEQLYTDVSSGTDLREVTALVVRAIDGLPGVHGVAGGVPGFLVPSSRSVVLIATDPSAGSDLRFNPEEKRLLGETMAHEVGHWLGLFHPVEAEWDGWDALDDTPECDSRSSCITELGTNLMFPAPVCGDDGCLGQETVTEDQAAVWHRSVWAE